ncbi:DUF2993 domain-containing protein [Mariniluteicoccus endophyticus]
MTAASRRRSGCGPLAFLLIGALLAVLLVGGDRFAHGYAERQVAARLRTDLGMATEPQLDINGVPFLTQVVNNRFGSVDMHGSGLHLYDGRESLSVDRLDVHLTDVVTANRYQRITASGLEGTAVLGWREVSRLAKIDLSYAGGDRVAADLSPSVFGQTITFKVSGRPVIDPTTQALSLVDTRAELAGQKVPDSIVDLAMDMLKPTPIQLPLGLRATGVATTAEGLSVGLTGRDVRLAG